jgi:hypothetical protein
MDKTEKLLSDRDYQQTLRLSFNDVDASLTTNGFLIGKLHRKVEVTITTTTVLDDTAIYTFKEKQNNMYVTLYQYTIIYTNGGRTQMISAERTA